MSEPPNERQPLSLTTRRCTLCGETYTDVHTGCTGLFRDVMKDPPGPSALDELPPEARPYADEPSRQLNQYVLVSELGKGGMGTVWKAWDRKLTRWVAIKFLLGDGAEDIHRFQREAKLAARLHHPNIASVFEVGEAAGIQPGQSKSYFLAMEFIDGPPLAAAALTLREALEIFAKVADAVEAAHRGGVIHRDLKPQNVMLTSARWPYVMDFGLAKALFTESTLSASGTVIGTPSFMPPEQADPRSGEAIDVRSDVYSLGASLYAVLCGRPPFTADTPVSVLAKVCHEEVVPPRALNPEMPPEIEAVILKAMSKAKEDRYPSAQAFGDDLRRYLASQEVEARIPTALERAWRKVRRNAAGVLVGLALVAAAVGVAMMLAAEFRRQPLLRPRPGEFEERLITFGENLRTLGSEEDLAGMPEAFFRVQFKLPDGPPDARLAWAQRVRSLLEDVRARKRRGWALLDAALEALPLAAAGENPWFRAAEEFGFACLARDVEEAAARAREKEAAERAPREREAADRAEQWERFLGALGPGLRERHPILKEHAERLAALRGRFPAEIPGLDALNPLEALGLADPESRWARMEEALRAKEAALRDPGARPPTRESLRKLYTFLVAASALRQFLEGRTPEEAAEGLKPFGAELRKVGGPAPLADPGPKLEAVFKALAAP